MARIPYVDAADVPDRDLLVTAQDPGDLPPEIDHLLESPVRNVYRALGHNPATAGAFRGYMGTVWRESGLDVRQRELVILTAARAANNAYEFHQHVRHAIAAGISPAVIRGLTAEPADLDGLGEAERALVRYADAVCRRTVDDRRYDALASHFGESTVVGTTMLAAGYHGLARALEAFDVDTEEAFVGWNLETLGDERDEERRA